MTDRQIREQALSMLAIKTQAVRYDALVMSTYLDDERITGCRTEDLVEACRKLETSEWFPKFGELVTACKKARYDRAEAETVSPLKRLHEGPSGEFTREEAGRILDKLYAATGKAYHPRKMAKTGGDTRVPQKPLDKR